MADWEAVSAIGTCVGAFGTFVACVISLWQSYIANFNRVKIIVSKDMSRTDDPSKHYVGVAIGNKGNRAVSINMVGYRIRGKKGIYSINPNDCSDGIIRPFADHMLLPGQSISFYFDQNVFLEYLHEEFAKGHKIEFCCVDSLGRIYRINCDKKSWMDLDK